MAQRRIIGITGQKGSGKSTAAAHMRNIHGFRQYDFAEPLKHTVAAIFGFTSFQLYDQKYKEQVDPFWGVTPRRVMQVVGTELFRDTLPKLLPELKLEGETLWIRCFREWLRGVPPYQKNIVIADVRFDDEAKAIKDMGGEIWCINADFVQSQDTHASERGLMTIIPDHNIPNVYCKTNIMYEWIDKLV